MRRLTVLSAAAVVLAVLDAAPSARTHADPPSIYGAIRALGLGDVGYEVKDFVLAKDAAPSR
jgi:hypothetical protein